MATKSSGRPSEHAGASSSSRPAETGEQISLPEILKVFVQQRKPTVLSGRSQFGIYLETWLATGKFLLLGLNQRTTLGSMRWFHSKKSSQDASNDRASRTERKDTAGEY